MHPENLNHSNNDETPVFDPKATNADAQDASIQDGAIQDEAAQDGSADNATAEIYGLLACLLRQSPNQEILDWLSELEVEESDVHAMSNAWFGLKQASQTAKIEDLEDEYQDLFIGIGCGEVVPFSSWHIAGTLMEKPLVHIRQDLKRLGFERQQDVREPEDNIAALLEVMSMLQSEGFDDQQSFFNAHIKPWFVSFCNAIEQAKSAQYYQAVSRALRHFCLIEQTRYTQKSDGIEITNLK
ncbi:molecular chaperone [Vibrio sp. S11_S32]|uniref:TorD/DmsD family molecular chaperone n=1 Tax=Vibrio sp. S11_S32 TaxID=2720225 RepID=UPI001680F2F1|nr:molecular chaperone TorD family protein [Vibrio sp. S11_S32]MBD1575577.1 molecular chaperone [Vibrio sp. S11_S32]